MAAQIPSKCCQEGSLHSGTPKGRVETIFDLPTYISDPPSDDPPKGIIVMITDVFGYDLPNIRLLADRYAERIGCKVYIPDFFLGGSLPYSSLNTLDTLMEKNNGIFAKVFPFFSTIYNAVPWMITNRPSITYPRIYDWFRSLRTSPEGTSIPIGACGYCWGGKLVFLFASASSPENIVSAADPRPLIDIGFTAHPSALVLPAEMEAAKIPLAVSVGSEDFVLSLEGKKGIKEGLQKVMDRREEDNGHEGRFRCWVVKGAKHGFSTRFDPQRPEEVEQGKEAENQAVEWFTTWFSKIQVGKD